jgi:hypothetical protein
VIPRVLLPQRARGGVARVRERRLAGLDQRGVERLEVGQPEVHLAAHLDQLRNGNSGVPVSRSGTSSSVRMLSVMSSPVRPSPRGERPGEQAVLVEQVHREPVDLQLAEVGHGADLARDALGPGPQLVRGEGVVQAEHALQVVVRRELRGELAAHLLRGRIRGRELGMALLELHQLPPQRVELPVGDDRRVEHVVAELMISHLGGQPRVSLTSFGIGAHAGEANEGDRQPQPGEHSVGGGTRPARRRDPPARAT